VAESASAAALRLRRSRALATRRRRFDGSTASLVRLPSRTSRNSTATPPRTRSWQASGSHRKATSVRSSGRAGRTISRALNCIRPHGRRASRWPAATVSRSATATRTSRRTRARRSCGVARPRASSFSRDPIPIAMRWDTPLRGAFRSAMSAARAASARASGAAARTVTSSCIPSRRASADRRRGESGTTSKSACCGRTMG
jgi:hypothetical protein